MRPTLFTDRQNHSKQDELFCLKRERRTGSGRGGGGVRDTVFKRGKKICCFECSQTICARPSGEVRLRNGRAGKALGSGLCYEQRKQNFTGT
jgi:hypothetical protein